MKESNSFYFRGQQTFLSNVQQEVAHVCLEMITGIKCGDVEMGRF